jgi:hypothetical protein
LRVLVDFDGFGGFEVGRAGLSLGCYLDDLEVQAFLYTYAHFLLKYALYKVLASD